MLLTFDQAIYDKTALLKAAYAFTDRAYIHLGKNEGQWLVDWTTKDNELLLPQEFENELIHQQLRLALLRDNSELRTLLLARAFASTVMESPSSNSAPQSVEQSTDNVLKGWFDEHGAH